MAFTTGVKPLPGYPMPVGGKIKIKVDRTGPASYTQFTTPATGGDVMNAADVGVGGFDFVDGNVDTTGQFQVFPVLNLGGYDNAVPSVILVYYALVTGTIGGQSQTAGSQATAATNLSTFSFRLDCDCV